MRIGSKDDEEQAKIKGDQLLKIIEEGNPEDILLEEYVHVFNELIKYELITIRDGKICLTERGIRAKVEGVGASIEEYKILYLSKNVIRKSFQKNYLYILLMLLLILSFIMFFILLI